MNKIIITLILSMTQSIFGQTEITKEHYDINLDVEVGEKMYVKDSIGNPLKNGDYFYKVKDGREQLSFWFSVLDSSEINGEVKLNVGDNINDQSLIVYNVKNGVVIKEQKFNFRRKYLEDETLFIGDTLVERSYKINKLLYYELKKVKGVKIYKYSCSNYYEKDYIEDCTKIDYVNGIEQKLLNGALISQTRTKKLPSGQTKVIENFSTEEKIMKTIFYSNGKKKIIYRNGNYNIEKPIENGYSFEKYDNKGKLIDSGNVYNIQTGF